MEDVNGRTAFITGGARGIGLGIGRAFARAGVKLAIADIDPDALAAAKSELAKLTAV
jgi:NAD(P)-dependent dehydrogenase (short-subunit alcohol dehydrogenase family)